MDTLQEHRLETASLADAMEWLDAQIGPEPEGLPDPDGWTADPWHIATPGAADWALRKILDQDALLAAAEEAADAEIARWQRWKQEKHAEHAARTQFLRGHLEAFTRQCHEETGVKSIPLPAGTLALRKVPARWVWPGEEDPTTLARLTSYALMVGMGRITVKAAGNTGITLEAWALRNNLPARAEIDKAALRKSCTVTQDGDVINPATGEIVPGVHVEDTGELTFSLK